MAGKVERPLLAGIFEPVEEARDRPRVDQGETAIERRERLRPTVQAPAVERLADDDVGGRTQQRSTIDLDLLQPAERAQCRRDIANAARGRVLSRFETRHAQRQHHVDGRAETERPVGALAVIV